MSSTHETKNAEERRESDEDRSAEAKGHGIRRRRPAAWGALVFAIIFLVFGLADILVGSAGRAPLSGDSAAYLRTADGIAHCLTHPSWTLERLFGGGFTPEQRVELGFDGWILQHAPLYLMPLACTQAVAPGETSARLLSALFLAGLGALLYDLGRRLFSPLVGAAACLLFLFHPSSLVYGTAVLTEMCLAFLAVLGGWLLVRWFSETSKGASLALGLGLGALYLGKITWRPLLPILVLVAGLYLWKRRDRLSLLTSLGVGLAVVLIPWWIGLSLAGLPANPFSETGEDMLWLYRGNNVELQGWETVGAGDAISREFSETSDEVRRSGGSVRKAYQVAFLRGIQEHPVQWVSLVGRKLFYFWTRPAVKHYTDHALWTMPPWLALLPWLVLAALLGWLLSLSHRTAWLAALPAIYLGFAHAASHLVSRYNVPAQPVVALYAAALPWVLVRGPWLRRSIPSLGSWRNWILPAVILAFACVGWVFAHPPWRTSRGILPLLSWAAPAAWAAALTLLGWLAGRHFRRSLGASRATFWGCLGAGLLGGFLVLGFRGSDPDWDRFSVRLEKPGDAVVQEIGVPATVDRRQIGGVYLEMDLARSVSGDFALEVWVQERLAHVYLGSLGAAPEDFLLERSIHGYQNRHRRVLETLNEHVEGYLEPRYGERSPGLDGIRRWVRLPLHPLDLVGRDTLRVKLLLRRAGPEAYVQLFGDRAIPSSGTRVFTGPAFFTNPYQLSNYRFRLLEGNRLEADYRLWRQVPLESPWGRSLFLREGTPGDDLSRSPGFQGGEYRIRLRVRLPGQYVWRTEGGRNRLVWASVERSGDRLPDGEELRNRMSHYQDYFDGHATF